MCVPIRVSGPKLIIICIRYTQWIHWFGDFLYKFYWPPQMILIVLVGKTWFCCLNYNDKKKEKFVTKMWSFEYSLKFGKDTHFVFVLRNVKLDWKNWETMWENENETIIKVCGEDKRTLQISPSFPFISCSIDIYYIADLWGIMLCCNSQ